jgi:alpha,alpha-trehalose phosphorylase
MSHATIRAADLELVIFDLDGVLADSSAAHASAWSALFDEIGLTAVPYQELAGRPTLDVVRERTKGLNPSESEILKWVETKQTHARRSLADAPITFADTAPAITRLQAAGLRLSVGTGASAETASLLLARAGVADAFEAVVTAADTANGKPDPEVYQSVLSRTGVSGERAIVVEDGLSGLESARAAGTWSASVRSGIELAGPRFCGAFDDLGSFVRSLGLER